MVERVTRPDKIVTDPVVLSSLARQGINKDYVEFVQDYSKRGVGKSPYMKTYLDLKGGSRISVISGLPMVDAYGYGHELEWRERNGVIENGNNIFHATVNNGTIRLVVLSDQPYGVKKDTECSYHAQLIINGSEVLANSIIPLVLATDPVNPNYHYNTLLSQYDTICRRRVRLIPGGYREWWLIDSHPNGRVEIRHNKTGRLKLKYGSAFDARGMPLKVKVVGDSEIIEASEFDNKVFPVQIGATLTVYPDTNAAGVDGQVGSEAVSSSWTTTVGDAGGYTNDTATNMGFFIISTSVDNEWNDLRRIIFVFDESDLAPGAVVSATQLSLYGSVKVDNLSITPDTNVYASAPASNVALVNGDFDSFGTTALSTAITYTNWKITDPFWNDFAFNAAGIVIVQAAADGDTVVKLGTRNANYDVAEELDPGNHAPNWTSELACYCNSYMTEQGAGFKPKLVITYETLKQMTASMGAKMVAGKMI